MSYNEIKSFRSLFIGREDAYGFYYPNGNVTVKKERITDNLLEKHLNQEITIGSYYAFQVNEIHYCKWICLDIDDHNKSKSYDELKLLGLKIKNELMHEYTIKENQIILEFSGRGFHNWIFLKEHTTLKRAYDFKIDIEKHLSNVFEKCFFLEIFPKQASIDNGGYGNWVKLPLSINRKNGKFCDILDKLELSEYRGYEIPEWIQKQENEKKMKISEPSKEILKTPKIEVKNECFEWFLTQMRPCLRAIAEGKLKTHGCEGDVGNRMNLTLADTFIYLGAPDHIIHKAFENQPDYSYYKTQGKLNSIRKKFKTTYALISCEKIKERGFCIECDKKR